MTKVGEVVGLVQILSWGVRRHDRNRLCAFERAAYSSIADQRHPNVAFLSLRHQLLDWLAHATETTTHGLPPWWRRRTRQGEIVAEQRTVGIVGAASTLPMEAGPLIISFGLRWEAVSSADLSFALNGFVREVRVKSSSRAAIDYPTPEGMSVDQGSLEDERPFWSHLVAGLDRDLAPVGERLLEWIESGGHAGGPIVLPARPQVGRIELSGIEPGNGLLRLLRLANGIRIGPIAIWGWTADRPESRVFRQNGRQFVYVGSDVEATLAVEVIDHAADDQVYRIAPVTGRLHPTGRNVLELCREALAGM
ncbi:MAG: hypothetical protein MUF84_18465 [Anaerolineae bacterium]|nr:hypothetical protein [Anaerolineae bacterium]